MPQSCSGNTALLIANRKNSAKRICLYGRSDGLKSEEQTEVVTILNSESDDDDVCC